MNSVFTAKSVYRYLHCIYSKEIRVTRHNLISLIIILYFSLSTCVFSQTWESYYNYNQTFGFLEHKKDIYLYGNKGILKYDQRNISTQFWGKLANTMPIPRMIDAIVDNDDKIWFASRRGGVYRLFQNEWKFYSTHGYGHQSDMVNCINVDSLNRIWFGTHGGGLGVIDGENIEFYNQHNSIVPDGFVYDIHIDEQNVIWIVFNRYILMISGEEWKLIPLELPNYPYMDLREITTNGKGTIWCVGLNSIEPYTNLLHYDGNKWEIFNETLTDFNWGHYRSFYLDSDNTVWIATTTGIVSFNSESWRIYTYTNIDAEITDITVEKGKLTASLFDGSLLLGSVSEPQQINFPEYTNKVNNGKSIAVDTKNNIWIISESDADNFEAFLTKFDGTNWSIIKGYIKPIQRRINEIFSDSKGTIWMTHENSMNISRMVNDQWNRFHVSIPGASYAPSDFAEDINGEIWFSFGRTLGKYVTDNIFEIVRMEPYIEHYSRIFSFDVDNSNNFWFANGYTSLLRFDGINAFPENISIPSTEITFISDIKVDNNNNIWVTAREGLLYKSGSEWNIFNIGNSGIPSNRIADFVFDKNNNLWVATQPYHIGTNNPPQGGGLAHYDGNEWEVFNYENSPLLSNWLESVAIGNNEEIIIGSSNGLNIFYPDTSEIIFVEKPSSFVAQPVSNSEIKLNWTSVEKCDSYILERNIAAITDFIEIAELDSATTSYIDNNLHEHITYHYRIKSRLEFNYSRFSNVISSKTFYTIPFKIPSDLVSSEKTITSADSLIKVIELEWSDESPNETGFYIERRIVPMGEFSRIDSIFESDYKGNSTVIYTDYFVQEGFEYEYRVNCFNPAGVSEYSNSTLIAITSVKENNFIPSKNSLNQNYPNPFNATTIITYEIAKSEFVKIYLYNLLGEKMKTLASEWKEQGQHSLILEANHMPSGVYLYKIKAGKYTETKKMLLLK